MPGVNTRGGRRSSALSSPTTSTHPQPPTASIPKLKLKLRATPTPTSTPPPSIPPPSRKAKDKAAKSEARPTSRQSSPAVGTRTRKSHADQRAPTGGSATLGTEENPHVVGLSIDDSDSDLTPEDEDSTGDVQGGVDLELEATPPTHEEPRASGSGARVSAGKEKNVGTSGPGGRERKRAVKIEERERRRARDAKFALNEEDQYPGSEASEDDTPSRRPVQRSPSFRASSRRSRSRSRHRSSSRHSLSSHGLGHESDPDLAEGLPEAFAGQEIEDLHYGAGPAEIEMQREVISGWWDGEEDDEMFISQLSGSEADRQSQSSVASDSDDPMSGSEEGSTSDDEVDEYGFPLPSQDLGNTSDQGPLVLMENWDGQFVLVQPRQERSRSRRRGSRGSRTAGSVGASTTFSVGTGAEGGLIIDQDAMDQDSSDSEWSGLSDESEGGDTTDSMAEEDMPMLDSPALDLLIGEQMANVSMGVAVKPTPGSGPSSATTSVGPSVLNGLPETTPLSTTPSIVVTDFSEPTATPALLDGSLTTPTIDTGPDTPLALPSAPMMGTFHPTTSHPAQHAVIDGSKTPTKSPFTHRRRSRKANDSVRGRSDSFPSIVSRDERERKRKSLQFDADHFAVPDLPKRLRYSSIPGHPRYIAAKRAASDMEMEGEDTPSDEEPNGEDILDLEDMLEESILSPMDDVADEQFRFDRVPVSRYLKRHFGSGSRRGISRGGHHGHSHHHPNGHAHSHANGRAWSLPTPGPGMPDSHLPAGLGLGVGSIGGLDHTLAGPVGRMMLLSPGLAPVLEDRALSRKEKRRKKKRAAEGQEIPQLSI